jgi:hypothetical protein
VSDTRKITRKDTRLIGREVSIYCPGTPFDGATGTVVAFRGKDRRGPWVSVRTCGAVYPFNGCRLTVVDAKSCPRPKGISGPGNDG